MKTSTATNQSPEKRMARKVLVSRMSVVMFSLVVTRSMSAGSEEPQVQYTQRSPAPSAEANDAMLAQPTVTRLSYSDPGSVYRSSARVSEPYREDKNRSATFSEENSYAVMFDRNSIPVTLSSTADQPKFWSYTARPDGPRYDVLRGTFAQVGGGLEYRLTVRTRGFIDASRVLRDEEKYTDVIRIGLRYDF